MSAPVDAEPTTYERVCRFLFDEAAVLDDGDLDGWLALMSPDLRYQVRARTTRERRSSARAAGALLFDDTFETLSLRVARLGTDFAWSEDPPSRTRHFVTNVRVDRDAPAGDLRVSSCVLVYRNRGASPAGDTLIGDRDDRLRADGDGFRIVERQVTLDQSTLGSMNLSFFL